MSLFIIARHAESGFNGENRIQGHVDSALTRRGERQAALLSRHLAGRAIRRIYTSDLGRALATTRIVARRLGRRFTADRALREIHLGSWEGLTPNEVNTRFQNGFRKWRRSPSRMLIPGGERMPQFRGRVRRAFRRIFEKEKTAPGTVLIVTHGGVIASLVADWLSADFDRVILDLRLDNTGLTFVEYGARGLVIHAINDIFHLGRKKLNVTAFTQHR